MSIRNRLLSIQCLLQLAFHIVFQDDKADEKILKSLCSKVKDWGQVCLIERFTGYRIRYVAPDGKPAEVTYFLSSFTRELNWKGDGTGCVASFTE